MCLVVNFFLSCLEFVDLLVSMDLYLSSLLEIAQPLPNVTYQLYSLLSPYGTLNETPV